MTTSELREQIAASIWASGHGTRSEWDEISETTREVHRSRADALLAGPLAPLLAKLEAVKKLAEELADVADDHIGASSGSHLAGARDAHYAIARHLRDALDGKP